MTKPNSYYREIKDAQQYNFDDRLTSNCYLLIENECFSSSSYLSEEEEHTEEGEDKMLLISCSVLVGILLLNLGIYTPQISSTIKDFANNSIGEIIEANK